MDSMSKVTAKLKEYFERIERLLGKSFYHDPLMILVFTLFGILVALLLLLLIFQVQPNISQIPLSYNVLYGVTYSTTWYGIYSYLFAIIGLGILNFSIAWAFFEKERLISYLISWITLFISVLTILYVYNLTALVK